MKSNNLNTTNLVLSLCLFLVSSSLFSQKIGFINKDSILNQVEGYNQKSIYLDSLNKVYSKEIEQLNLKARERYSSLLLPYSPIEGESMDEIKKRLSTEDLEKLALLNEDQVVVNLLIKNYNDLLFQYYERELLPIVNCVDQCIKDLSKKKKIEAIFILEEMDAKLAFYNSKLNLTDEIVAEVNSKLKKEQIQSK